MSTDRQRTTARAKGTCLRLPGRCCQGMDRYVHQGSKLGKYVVFDCIQIPSVIPCAQRIVGCYPFRPNVCSALSVTTDCICSQQFEIRIVFRKKSCSENDRNSSFKVCPHRPSKVGGESECKGLKVPVYSRSSRV